MSSRADRRRQTREIIKHSKSDDVEILAQVIHDRDQLKEWCRQYKARLELSALVFGSIQAAILKSDWTAVQKMIAGLGKSTLKDAVGAVGNRRQALGIAVNALVMSGPEDVGRPISQDAAKALEQIRTLCPEAFNEPVEAEVSARA